MVKFICSNCNYRCDLENHVDCPYCGKDTLEQNKSAKELLEEVERVLEDG